MPTAHANDDPSHVPSRAQQNPRTQPRPKLDPPELSNGTIITSATEPEHRKSPTTERENRPQKRSRKAINCEPCRNSKLKCDRGRPCSSCVLRGTALHCYQGTSDDAQDVHRGNRIDPHHELARIRNSLATLEAFVIRGSGINGTSPATAPAPSLGPSPLRQETSPGPPFRLKSEVEGDDLLENSAPGMLAQKSSGGLYAGPTSMVTHFLTVKSPSEGREDDSGASSDQQHPEDGVREIIGVQHTEQTQLQYDTDLLRLLPQLHIIDGLVDFYFENCNWVYRHVHPPSFQSAWSSFKQGLSSDRLVLATLCVIMGVAVRYLPERHALLASLPHEPHEELGERYYDIARDALSRYRAESGALSLELVELLLIRTHYLTLSKDKSEEIYSIRGELVSMGTAMGLHRDPDKWNMSREVAERRRWAWWHILLCERWQCFLFGRPLSIAAHHFDTSLPSAADLSGNRTIYAPNLHLFRLAHILGDIVDDAVSIRPVPYERVMERDRQLVAWMDELPKDLDLDEFRVARALASPIPPTMRLGVQSIIIRSSYHHIRFTLHRPHAAAAHDFGQSQERPHSPMKPLPGGSNGSMDERMAQSLDIAVHAADRLIHLSAQARPDLLANSSLTVPGHMHWGPFHCFSAAMFFSFQLIANPDQPGANLFRSNIRKVLEFLGLSRGVGLAEKAIAILNALAPLYEPSQPGETETEHEKKKKTVLATVRGLAFPYHDSQVVEARTSAASPVAYGRRGLDSPQQGTSSMSQVNTAVPGNFATSPTRNSHFSHGQLDTALSPVTHRPPPSHSQIVGYPTNGNVSPQQPSHNGMTSMPPPSHHHHHHSPPLPPALQHHHSAPVLPVHQSTAASYASQMPPPPPPHPRHQFQPQGNLQSPEYSDLTSFPQTNEMTMQMWGASVGFGQGEWTRFIDSIQRPEA